VLTKPVTNAKLHEALQTALNPGSRPATATSRHGKDGSPHGRQLRILIAEDNATNRRIIRTHLEDWGHSVVMATDGTEALERFDAEPFDLVLMDLQMPRMDGIAATASIRQREKAGAPVPIIALTANVLKGVREECHASGMDGYLGKPVREHELLAAIESVVPGLRAASELAASHVVVPLTVVPAPSGGPFQVDALLASVNGSRATLSGLLHDCRDDDAPGLFSQISEALAENDTRRLQRAAHALKGVLGVFHAPAAYAAARQLEESARMGRTEHLVAQAEELRHAVSELLSSLERFLADPGQIHRAA
jgi:CheY-like chemotaxis protein/HPt (histidine-containing phosphotransfer) domain-containing protein